MLHVHQNIHNGIHHFHMEGNQLLIKYNLFEVDFPPCEEVNTL